MISCKLQLRDFGVPYFQTNPFRIYSVWKFVKICQNLLHTFDGNPCSCLSFCHPHCGMGQTAGPVFPWFGHDSRVSVHAFDLYQKMSNQPQVDLIPSFRRDVTRSPFFGQSARREKRLHGRRCGARPVGPRGEFPQEMIFWRFPKCETSTRWPPPSSSWFITRKYVCIYIYKIYLEVITQFLGSYTCC